MKRLSNSLLALILSLATVGSLRAQPAEPSRWSGNVELPGGITLDFSVSLTGGAGTISIPMQGVKDMPLQKVSVSPKELRFSIEKAGADWEMTIAEDGQTASGVLKQGGSFKSTLKKLAAGETAGELKRPQEPKPPFPYDAAEVTIEHKAAALTLAGTLTMPKGSGPFPCVVLVSGSGAQDRDEALMGHKPFLVLADHLAHNGIAALRYDDRGTGKSTGNFEAGTSDDFALDALAAIEFLKSQPKIDAKHLGIVGHSEGGLIAPMCASKSKDIAFIVLLAGPGISGRELLPVQNKLILLANGASEAEAQTQTNDVISALMMIREGKPLVEIQRNIRAAVIRELSIDPSTKELPEEQRSKQADELAKAQTDQLTSVWFRRFLEIDPRENLRKVTCPVLAVNGEKDLQVPPEENLSEIEKALKASGNADVSTLVFPGLNHLFQTCKTGSPSEYAAIEETFAPVALDAISSWIRARTGLER